MLYLPVLMSIAAARQWYSGLIGERPTKKQDCEWPDIMRLDVPKLATGGLVTSCIKGNTGLGYVGFVSINRKGTCSLLDPGPGTVGNTNMTSQGVPKQNQFNPVRPNIV